MKAIPNRGGPLTMDKAARFDAWALLDQCEAAQLTPMQTAYYFARLAAAATRICQATMPPDVFAAMHAAQSVPAPDPNPKR